MINQDPYDIVASALSRMRYGAPSSWEGSNPAGWHLPEPCSPRDASMHDNGINDALRAVREAQRHAASKPTAPEGPIAWAAEEAECVRMVLDDMGVPKRGEDGDLSLVGRLMVAIVTYGQGFDPVSELRIAIAAHGSQKAFAERAGVSAQYVNDVLQRRREPGFAITQALGLERVVAYRKAR